MGQIIGRDLLIDASADPGLRDAAMLETLSHTGSKYPIHLIYGVTNDADLVLTEKLTEYAKRLANFTFACCVAIAV
jgi:benzoate/toluate 1,2-dioxygenase reductase subunit